MSIEKLVLCDKHSSAEQIWYAETHFRGCPLCKALSYKRINDELVLDIYYLNAKLRQIKKILEKEPHESSG